MSATFRKFLVFEMATGQSGALQFVDCAPDIFRAAETGIGIHDRRNFHRPGNETGERRDFVQREQSNIRQTGGAIREARAADVNRLEPGTLHLPRHRGIRHARHRDDAMGDQFAKFRRYRLNIGLS